MPQKIKSNGKWLGVIKYRDGKRKTKRFATMREAVEWETEGRNERDRQAKIHQGSMTLSINYVGPWLEGYLLWLMNKNQKREWREKFNFFKKFITFVGPTTPVSKISPAIVMSFLDRDQSRSGNARNKDLDRLQWAWNWAVKVHNFPFKSPFSAFDKFPEIRNAKYIPPMSNILNVVKYADREDKLILLLSLATAARRVEIFRIQVATDFIAEDNIVVLTTEKTNGRGQRRDKVKIPENLSAEIQRYIVEKERSANLFNYVCPERGEWNDRLKELCIAQGVKPFTIHAIRHRVATELIKQKVPLTDVQSLLRHTRASTTDKYIHNIGENLDVTYHASSIIASFLDFEKVA